MPKRYLFPLSALFLGLILTFHGLTACFAQERTSGFLLAKGQYFDTYGYQGTDIYSVLKKLDFSVIRPEYVFEKSNKDLRAMLSEVIDAIFLETSDILDIHIYSFKARIELLDSQGSVSEALYRRVRQTINESSFYFPENKTIYISAADITLGMLGHEMAHAIIDQFFVVPPPEKIQEVLSGYVEYNLQKKSKKLFKAPVPNK